MAWAMEDHSVKPDPDWVSSRSKPCRLVPSVLDKPYFTSSWKHKDKPFPAEKDTLSMQQALYESTEWDSDSEKPVN